MATNFTLDDIRNAAEAKYGSTDIEMADGTVVVLMNPLRLPKTKRDELTKIGELLEADDADQAEIFADALRLAAKSKSAVEKLIEEIDGDLAVLAQVFEAYTQGAQVGEASASQD